MHCPFYERLNICGAGVPEPGDMMWGMEDYECDCTREYYEEHCKEDFERTED